MSSLTEVEIPENGLLLLFTPNEPGSYEARMAFNPGDMGLEDIKFYVALGQGLMHAATQSTDEVVALGVHVITEMEAEKGDSRSEGITDDPNEFPGMPTTTNTVH
jgi:hypothetical protein